MRVGLVRHFKVNVDKPGSLMTSRQFEDWVRHYDEAEIVDMEANGEEPEWDICFSSDLPRAVHTAEKTAGCSVIKTELLREVPLAPFIKTNRRLPFPLWNIMGRLAWLSPYSSQPECRRNTVKRAKSFIEIMETSGKENVLIVSHALFLSVLVKELRKQDYKGTNVKWFKNGQLHIWEKGRR